jgi:hypothetical protein
MRDNAGDMALRSGTLRTPATPFAWRLVGAARLDPRIYEEVEADTGALGQAVAVVLLATVAAGIGLAGFGALQFPALLVGSLAALAWWVSWAVLTYMIGTHLLPEAGTRADTGELLRTIGFSAAPGLLAIVAIVPGLTRPVFLIIGVWMLATMIVAVRQALDYSTTTRAIAVCATGWALSLVFALGLGLFMPRTLN